MTFSVAIMGRPNVGKSTLFNRLTRTRHALVHDEPGVTRDWREGEGSIGSLQFTVFDTPGLDDAAAGTLEARMREQAQQAADRADVVLMVIDGRAGLTPLDIETAKMLRRSKKPCVLLVNKMEGGAGVDTLHESHRLGLGDPIAFSAEHGEGMADLAQVLVAFDREEEEAEQEEDGVVQLAIIGRPNAGKSTLLNCILGEERVLTGPEAGITRDAIAVPYVYEGKQIKLVDTAGIRRRRNVTGSLEKLSVADTLRAIRYAQVVVVVMDAQFALEKQDNAIVDLVEKEGRAVVIAINKWDRVEQPKAFLKNAQERIAEVLPQVRGVELVPISARDGSGIGKLFRAAFSAYARWNVRLTTGELNRWLEAALARHSPPLVDGRRLKIKYMTQAKTRPPTFHLFCNISDVPEHYLRYLSNDLRQQFDLPGVPLRFKIRTSENPYADKRD